MSNGEDGIERPSVIDEEKWSSFSDHQKKEARKAANQIKKAAKGEAEKDYPLL